MVPRFIKGLKDQYVKETENAEFVCKVHPPTAKVVWIVNGKEIKDSKKYDIHREGADHCLVIVDAQEDDEGRVVAMVDDSKTEAVLFVEGMIGE